MRQAMLATLLFGCLVGASTPTTSRNDDWVRQRVRAIREGDTDAWRRIPWSATLSAAAAAARREGRPMFVFSHEGNIDTGRC